METKPGAASGLGKPPAANPVMDVVAPPPTDHEEQPEKNAETDPLDQLVAEDQAEQTAHSTKQEPAPKTTKSSHDHAQPGVMLAVIATIVIVLGLAALATYAYLQTAK